jgi:tetratricopeptide (TPR) repeat protein
MVARHKPIGDKTVIIILVTINSVDFLVLGSGYSNMRMQAHLKSSCLVALTLVSACAMQQSSPDLDVGKPDVQSQSNNSEQLAQHNTNDSVTLKSDYPVRSFPTQTFYELLVAEVAGTRGDLKLALDKYVEQAHITRDPNVTERAVRTATFLKNNQVLRELSELWVAVDPDSIDAHKLGFFFQAREGNIETAFEHCVFLLDQGDGELLVALPGYTDNFSTEELTALLDSYVLLENKYPDNRSVLLGKIRLEARSGDIDKALLTGNILLALEPDNENARLAIAQLLYKYNRKDNAMTILNSGIARSPENKNLQLQLIRFIAESDVGSAREQLQQLSANHKEDLDLEFSLALLNKQLGMTVEASEIFEKMITRGQRVDEARFQLGVIADEEGDIGEALAHYVLVGEGKYWLASTGRVVQLMAKKGNITEARLYLHRLRIDHPDNEIALYRIESELLIRVEHFLGAHTVLTEGLEEHPDNFDLLYTRSLVSEKLNDITSMEQDLRHILRKDANNASALNALGYSLANYTDRYSEALELIEQALAIQPNDPAIIDSLGWALYRTGDNEKAVLRLREAMAAMPDPEVAAHLGEVLWVSGLKDEALNIWREALLRDPDSKHLLDTLDRFEVDF